MRGDRVEIRISVVNGNLADLESLDFWLQSEPELVGRVKLAGPPPRQGELGALAETIIVAVGAGGAVTTVGPALAGALKAWLSHRNSDVTLEITQPDGTKVKIVAERVRAADMRAMIRLVFGPSATQAPSPSAAEE